MNKELKQVSTITGISISKLEKYNSLSELFELSTEIECTKLQKEKLLTIKNMLLNYKPNQAHKYKVRNPYDLFTCYSHSMSYLTKEVFKVVLVNVKNEIITDVDISIGTLSMSVVHPREVFIEAIKRKANKIFILHNHPSGDITPSTEDKKLTSRLITAGELIGIEVLDHIIIGDHKYYSFKENDNLK